MKMPLAELTRLASLARELHDPSSKEYDDNPEYTRGQVNLICDASGIPYAMDRIGGAVEAYITYRADDFAGAVIDALTASS